VLKGPGQLHGTLRVDNLGTAGQQTVLPSLGFGIAQPGTGGATLVTNRGATIPAYFAGHWVEITRGGSQLGTWRIGAIADQTVTLEANGTETIDLLAGDAWQGVYRFDAVEVTGNAVLQSEDPVRDGPPTITVLSPDANTAVPSGSSVPVTFTTADDKGVVKVTLAIAGELVEILGPNPTGGVVVAPWVSVETTYDLVCSVLDTSGQTISTTVPLRILAAPPLTATVTYPSAGEVFWAGTSEHVSVVLPDARPIQSVSVIFGADTIPITGLTGPWLDIPLQVPVVGADETRTLAVKVVDEMGHEAQSSPVDVQIVADASPSVTAWADKESQVSPGMWVSVDFSASFRAVEGAKVGLHVSGSVTYDDLVDVGAFGTSVPGGLATLDTTQVVNGWFSSFEIPADANGLMTILVTAIDGMGRTGSAQPIHLDVGSPLSIAVSGPDVVAPGGTLELVLSMEGWFSQNLADVSLSGAFDWERRVSLGQRDGESSLLVRTIRIPIPETALGEGTVSFQVEVGESTLTSNTVSFTVIDATAPTVARVRSSVWGLVAGSEMSFRADVSDDGAIQQVRFFVNGAPIEGVSTRLEKSTFESGVVGLPAATEPTSLVVRVEATDAAGNTRAEERTLALLPAGTPLVRFLAPTSGAMAIAGEPLPLLAQLRHPRPITQLAFYRDDESTPFATTNDGGVTAELVVPPDATTGSEITLWVEATDDLGAIGEASAVVRVVAGALLLDGTIVEADDLSHEDQTVVVQGRVTVRGAHRFARLLVLPGAALTHGTTAGEMVEELDVEVTDDAYVSRTGSIDAVGLGFEGGLQGSNTSLDGLTLPGLDGSTGGAGGSHGGRGEGIGDGVLSGSPYGSVRSPNLPGSGGSASVSGGPGGAGGGVIRLVVGGRLVVDGDLNASGAQGAGGAAGAGGSVFVQSARIGGSGRVLALGGDPGATVGENGSAGGGRISILGVLEDEVPSFSAASGAAWYASGGPGTVFLRSPEDRDGHLVLDVGACERPSWGGFAGLGAGYLSYSGGRDRSFQVSLSPGADVRIGQPVEVLGDNHFVGRFVLEAFEPSDQTVTLDESAAGLFDYDQTYRGVQVFDSVNLRARAGLWTGELLEARLFVDPSAALESATGYVPALDQTPWIWASIATQDVSPGASLDIDTQSDDDLALLRYAVWIEGVDGSQIEVPIPGMPTQDARTIAFVIPATLSPGDYLLGVGVYDGAEQRTAMAFPIHVAPSSGFVASASTGTPVVRGRDVARPAGRPGHSPARSADLDRGRPYLEAIRPRSTRQK